MPLTIAKQAVLHEAIKKTASKRLKQDAEKPFFLDEGGMAGYYKWLETFFKGLGNVLYIIPALVMAILNGCSAGMLAGLRTALDRYEKHLGRS